MRALNYRGGVEFAAARPERALPWHEQALEIAERLQDPEETGRSLHYMAESLRDMGSHARAAALYTRSIEIRRAHGLLEHVPSVLHSLGDLSLDSGDLDAAERYYRETLALADGQRDVRLNAYCLAGLACVAARGEDRRTAGRLWALAERIEREQGLRMLATERARYERVLAPPVSETDEFLAGAAEANAGDAPLMDAGSGLLDPAR